MRATVHPIRLSLSNAYLVRAEGNVLIDTGSPKEGGKLIDALRGHRVTPADLTLILHTHVHSDHVGSTMELLDRVDAPTAHHAADEPLMRQGNNGRLTGIGLRGKVMATFFSGNAFDRFAPSFHLEDGACLDEYGIPATVRHTPGHTPGSISVLLDDGEAIVGDVWMGGFVGGKLRPGQPNYHYFAEDEARLEDSMRTLLATKARTFHVWHGGPLRAERVRRRFGGG